MNNQIARIPVYSFLFSFRFVKYRIIVQYFFVRIEIVRIEFIYVCVYSSENNSCSYVTVEIMTYNLTTFRDVA